MVIVKCQFTSVIQSLNREYANKYKYNIFLRADEHAKSGLFAKSQPPPEGGLTGFIGMLYFALVWKKRSDLIRARLEASGKAWKGRVYKGKTGDFAFLWQKSVSGLRRLEVKEKHGTQSGCAAK